MKTKEEVIKEAYGEHWDRVKDYVDDNGWVYGSFQDEVQLNLTEWEGYEVIRPKTLAEVETNNGWIRIEDIENVPKEQCWIYKSWVGTMFIGYFHNEYGYNVHKDASHYKLIENPKPPIY